MKTKIKNKPQSVFREGIWYISNADNSFYTSQFGQTGDVPIPQ